MIAIDPGTTHSAILDFNGEKVTWAQYLHNDALLIQIRSCSDLLLHKSLAIEHIQCQGRIVGKETFDTCIFIGRVIEAAYARGAHIIPVYRNDVKLHLCDTMRGIKDSNVRQALIDKYGGKEEAKRRFHGVTSHLWQALAVADYALTGRK